MPVLKAGQRWGVQALVRPRSRGQVQSCAVHLGPNSQGAGGAAPLAAAPLLHVAGSIATSRLCACKKRAGR